MAVDSLQLLRGGALADRGVIGDDEPTLDVETCSQLADEPTHDLPVAAPAAGLAMPAGLPLVPRPQGEDPFVAGGVLCGRYVIEDRIGGGGSAVVLRARDLGDGATGDAGKRVAIKVLRPELRDSAPAVERLQLEFQRLRQLSHPGVVRVFELDRHEGQWFQVMELLVGDSLATLMSRPGALSVEAPLLRVLADCAEALAWAHARGFVHADVKPGNIFVKRDGSACLLDFGASEDGHEVEAVAGQRLVHATPAYASPQVLEGLAPEPRDDIFSLACVAFELLAGRHPFDRMSSARARAAGASVAEVPFLGHQRAAALAAGLSFAREGRPGDVRELINRVAAATGTVAGQAAAGADSPHEAVASRGPDRVVATGTTGRRLATAAMFAVLAAAGAWQALRPPRSPVGVAPPTASAHGLPVRAASLSAQPEATGSRSVTARVRTSERAATVGDKVPAAAAAATIAETQRLSFASGSLVVSSNATYAAIPLRRMGVATGRVQLAWRIFPGSAQPGRDYGGPASGAVAFADGQVASTLFVPLAGDGTAMEDRSFAVVLEDVRGAALGGEVTRVDVTLRPTDAGPLAPPR